MSEIQTVATTVQDENIDTTVERNGTVSAPTTNATVRKQMPRSCVSNSRAPSRTPSRASQRSVTFSLVWHRILLFT